MPMYRYRKLSALFALAVCIPLCLSAVFAEPALMLKFSEGSGEGEFGVASRTSSDGPIAGPMSMQPLAGGLVILDSVNSRIVKLDDKGKIIGYIALPAGEYTDMGVQTNGNIWIVETASRSVLMVSGDEPKIRFALPNEDGFPIQIDALLALDDCLVVGDYATSKLYWFSEDGKLMQTASWPTALGIVADASNNVCFLGFGDNDLYDRYIKVDKSGVATETKVEGYALEGARLIGFLADGRAVGCGSASLESPDKIIFAIDDNGKTSTLAAFQTPGGLLFSARMGFVSGKSAWLNLSPIDKNEIVFAKFDLVP